MADMATKQAAKETKQAEQARKKIAKERLQEDIKKGGALACKAVSSAQGARKEYVQPTHTVQTAAGLTSDPQQVQKAFADEWSEKVLNLQRQKPNWEDFQKAYGQYIPRAEYSQGIITGEEMFKVV